MKRGVVFFMVFVFVILEIVLISAPKKKGFSIEIKKISPFLKGNLDPKQNIYIWLSYKVPDDYKGGIYIWASPNSRNPILQPSQLIKTKTGSISRYFSINKGNTRVRKIWIRMMDKSRNNILAQKMIKVNLFTYPKKRKIKRYLGTKQ